MISSKNKRTAQRVAKNFLATANEVQGKASAEVDKEVLSILTNLALKNLEKGLKSDEELTVSLANHLRNLEIQRLAETQNEELPSVLEELPQHEESDCYTDGQDYEEGLTL